MGKKKKTIWICQNCGTQSLKWLGKCPGCHEWNTLVEEIKQSEEPPRGVGSGTGIVSKPEKITAVDLAEIPRFSSGSDELNRVLGGGVVPGSFVLVGGDPGIGKSTLLTHLAYHVAKNYGTVLYVSAEESAQQVKMRSERIGALADRFLVVSESNMDIVDGYVNEYKPMVLIIDSIQTVYKPDITSAPGSVVQVRECAAQFLRLSKSLGITVFIVGHVTKEGTIAGPRVLEHMVDTVLYFEGEHHTNLRILQGVKNRFGALEIGVYEVTDKGLIDVPNASELFLSERPVGASGSVVVPVMEGTRPLLVEVQALVGSANYQNARRTATGIDLNRLQLLIAVLEKRVGMFLGANDAFVKVTGGVKINEPAVDLGLAIALASSFRDTPVDPKIVVIGEVGLTGEVRSVSMVEHRLREAEKMGFEKAIIPSSSIKGIKSNTKLEILGASTLLEALEYALS